MIRRRKKIFFLVSIFCLIVLIGSFLFFSFKRKGIFAASSDNTIGWAWNENTGWISLNVLNDYNDDGILDDHGLSSWNAAYTGGGKSWAFGVVTDLNNNVIVTGCNSNSVNGNIYTIKYDSNGNELWNKEYDGGNNDRGYSVAVDSNNNIIVAGYRHNGLNSDYYTMKYDSNGNPAVGAWPKIYDGGGSDIAYGVAVDGNNNIIVNGISSNNFVTIKYDSNGNQIWLKTYDSGQIDYGGGVAVDSNNNIIITGYRGGAYDYITVKYDPDGNTVWTPAAKIYDSGGTNDRAQAVAVDSNNNIIVTGRGARPGYPTATDFMTIKYDSNGNLLSGWPVFYNGGSYDWAYGVATDSSNNIIVGGYRSNGTDYDYYTIKYNPNGNSLWDSIYNGGVGHDYVRGVAVDSADNIIVTGYIYKSASDDDYYTIKYNLTSTGYGVGINIIYPSGEVQGYGWSENIGWIQFNPVGPYPDLPNNSVYYNFNTKELYGWGKIINSGDNGWIKFQGPVESAPVQYNLCRSCVGAQPNKTCDFCYELTTDGGSGRIGTQCSICSDVSPTCRICSGNYKYGVSVLSYDLGSYGVKKILEGWAYNDATIGWIHFNYAYANDHAPLAFDNFTASLTQVPPINTCKSVDLSWESSSWASGYEIWKDAGSSSPQDCSTAVYSLSSGNNASDICSGGSCSAQDSSLGENTYYCFKVKATNDYDSIDCTNNTPDHPCPKQVKTPLCAPDNFTAEGAICGEINLSWTDKSNETIYKIYRSLTNIEATSSAALIATLEANNITYKDKNVIPGQTYYYLLTAGSASGDESPVAQSNAKTYCYKGPKFEEK